MESRKIHSSGPEFSRIITGAWRWQALSNSDIDTLIRESLDLGITTFDHADIYGGYSCEALFGLALHHQPSLREKMQLVTKCGIKLRSGKWPATWINHYDNTHDHIVTSVDNSLKNLRTDSIDLLLLHRPDPLLDPAEVAETFSLLKQSGKVRHFGVSNYTSTQFEMLQQYMHEPLVTNQIEVSLFRHHLLFDGTTDTLLKHRVSPMAWSPLGGGKFYPDTTDGEAIKRQVEEMAARYACSVPQLMLAWLLKHPSIMFPILGTTNPSRIREGAGALAVQLDRQDWFALLRIARGRDVD
jgi:predicted oxidoreductase